MWSAFVFLLVDAPGGLFPNGDLNYGLPMLTFPGLISFQEIFIYLLIIKALTKSNKWPQLIYQKPYQLLFFYFIFLLAFSIVIGVSPIALFKAIKWFIPYSLLLTVPILLISKEEWTIFFKIIFIFLFFVLASQIAQLVLGHPPSLLLGSNFQPLNEGGDFSFNYRILDPSSYEEKAARPISSSGIVLSCFAGAMFFLKDQQSYFKKNYLFLILFLSAFSILLTATRGWILSFSLALALFFLFVTNNSKSIIRVLFPLLVLYILVSTIPVLRSQLQGVQNRVSTVEAIAKGDITAEGTNDRGDYTVELLKVWKDSPIFGWGFSNTFRENMNSHAGQANLLMNVGIVGILIFIYFWYKLGITPIVINGKLSAKNPYKKALLSFSIMFLVYFFLHSTSGQQFQYLIGVYGISLAQIFFYCFSDFFMKDALIKEKQIKEQAVEKRNH